MEEKKKVRKVGNPFKVEIVTLIILSIIFAIIFWNVSTYSVSIAVNLLALFLLLAFLLAGMGKFFYMSGTGPLYVCFMDFDKLTNRLN